MNKNFYTAFCVFIVLLININTCIFASTFKIGVASSMSKIKRDSVGTQPILFPSLVELDMAKDETESFQLILIPQGQDLIDVKIVFKSNDFNNMKYEWYKVDYVKTGQSVYSSEEINWIPDPLFEAESLSVSKDFIQPIWINFHTRPTTRTGLYNFRIEVSCGDEIQNISVSINVRSFTLPRPGTLAAPFGNYRKVIEQWYYGRQNVLPKAIYDNWCDFLVQYRLTPKEVGNEYVEKQEIIVNPQTGEREVISVDMSALKNTLPLMTEQYLPDYSYAFYRLPSGSTLDKALSDPEHWWHDTQKLIAPIWKYKEEWDRQGFTDKTFIYGIDEPNSEIAYNGTITIYQAIKAANPQIKIMQTGNCNRPEFIGLVDIWCPISIRAWLPFFQERITEGDILWQYITVSTQYPYANFFIDEPGVHHRNLFWQTRKVGATGFLYWSTLWVDNYYPQAHQHEVTFPDIPWDYTNTTAKNGDGMLVYPGNNFQPIPSIRLNIIRDGIEDYEYFSLLRKIIDEQKENGENIHLISQAEALLQIPNYIVTNNKVFSKNENHLISYRKQIADMIESLTVNEENPVLIETKQDWLNLIDDVNNNGMDFSDIYFKLTADIDMGGSNIDPLGGTDNRKVFRGNIDGNEYSISNFNIEQANRDEIGLIGYMENGSVSNLTIINANIKGANYVGTIAGRIKNSIIENCNVHSQVTGHVYVGGIIGGMIGSCIKNCSSFGNITGTNAVGGIVGHTFPISK